MLLKIAPKCPTPPTCARNRLAIFTSKIPIPHPLLTRSAPQHAERLCLDHFVGPFSLLHPFNQLSDAIDDHLARTRSRRAGSEPRVKHHAQNSESQRYASNSAPKPRQYGIFHDHRGGGTPPRGQPDRPEVDRGRRSHSPPDRRCRSDRRARSTGVFSLTSRGLGPSACVTNCDNMSTLYQISGELSPDTAGTYAMRSASKANACRFGFYSSLIQLSFKRHPAFAHKHPGASPNRRGLVPGHYRLEPP